MICAFAREKGDKLGFKLLKRHGRRAVLAQVGRIPSLQWMGFPGLCDLNIREVDSETRKFRDFAKSLNFLSELFDRWSLHLNCQRTLGCLETIKLGHLQNASGLTSTIKIFKFTVPHSTLSKQTPRIPDSTYKPCILVYMYHSNSFMPEDNNNLKFVSKEDLGAQRTNLIRENQQAEEKARDRSERADELRNCKKATV